MTEKNEGFLRVSAVFSQRKLGGHRDGAKTSEASKCFGTVLDLEMPWVPKGNRNSFLVEFHRAHDRFRPKDASLFFSQE